MVKFIKHESKAQWLEQRSQNINSTESAALFGLSPYNTELEIFYRKQSGDVGEIAENPRMKAGKALEPAIARLVADELGCDVEPFKSYGYDDEDRIGSSFDFQITTGQYDGWLLEIKNVDFLIYRDRWEDDEAPDHRPGIIIACLVGGNDLKIMPRKRNEKMGEGIRQRIQKFWKDIEANTPPEPDFSRDAEFIISLYQSAGDKVISVEEGTQEERLLLEYHQIRADYNQLEKDSKAIKAQILTLIGDEPSKILCGLYTLSCGEIDATEVAAYTRNGYRNFRVTKRKPNKEKKK